LKKESATSPFKLILVRAVYSDNNKKRIIYIEETGSENFKTHHFILDVVTPSTGAEVAQPGRALG
jgi:hypothetical protein